MRKSKLLDSDPEEENFWPTFTDLLSVIILVILMVFISYTIVARISTYETREIQQEISRQIDDVAGFREEIALLLQDEIEESPLNVAVDDDSGTIVFSGGVLFETDSAEIRPEFKEMLEQIIPIYMETLLDEQYRDNISQIIVEGHTDDRGSYIYNLELSQERAFNVVQYILSDQFPDFEHKELLQDYITANGKSKNQLITDETGQVDREKSRRVEFKFNIRDRYWIEGLEEVIN